MKIFHALAFAAIAVATPIQISSAGHKPDAGVEAEVVMSERDEIYALADTIFDRLEAIGYGHLMSAEQVFICVWSLIGEVDNGGFKQWFFNSSGDWALDTPKALREIGAPLTAAMVERAIEGFPGGLPPRDLRIRRAKMERVSKEHLTHWDFLSNRFYREEENLVHLLREYMQRALLGPMKQ